ncbi:heavy metal-responsive transcriptional regulator [Ferroacidibacillus organovorans]|uniref:HTH merR-type domain-containing protein n=1 Tax=Ferroacidibacillus organovorans TaxID=1765683 RepID=A0A101XTE2_9BACL|nr:heavy metal-responsive transcriptional regulator [Ferroacidibacillus organovorans]KUO97242.1 hypothetical protein ATW55_11650 [Ferroacidibacillus organovorans]
MKKALHIGELSRQFLIPTQTVRYYEKIGLLDPPHRTDARYRVYSEYDVERLRFILQAKHFGLSLDEIKEIIKLRTDGIVPCQHVQNLVKRHLDDLDVRIKEMLEFRDTVALRYQMFQEVEAMNCSGTICKYIEKETLT